jgi:uncharacterized protein (TIGR02118 family)
MIKMVALVRKKREMSKEDFRRYWLEVHAPLEKKWPGLKKYVISVAAGGFEEEAEYDGMAELWFEDEKALKKALASEERRASREDFIRFVGGAKIMLTEEYVIINEMNKT